MVCRCVLAAALLAAASIAAVANTAGPFHAGEDIRLFHPSVQRHWRGANTQALVTRM